MSHQQLNFESLIQKGSQCIIPIFNQANQLDLNLLRQPNIIVICGDQQRDIYLQLLLDKSPEKLMIKIAPDQIITKVILLMRDSNRANHVNSNLQPIFPKLEISPAIDAMTPHAIDNFVQTHQVPILKPIRAGKIGCILSHLQIWKQLLSSIHPAILIMEDDIIPMNNFHQRFNLVLEELPPTFDLLYLHLDEEKNYSQRSGLDFSTQLKKNIPREDTCAYLISRKGANRLIQVLKTIRDPLGTTLKKQIEINALETYTVKDALFTNIGQRTATQKIGEGILKSNTCNSQLYMPNDN